jgi:ATP/maltotriose-dependent transcriptional regulator MalT
VEAARNARADLTVALVRAGTQLLQAGRGDVGRALVDRAETIGRPLAETDASVGARLAYARGWRALLDGDPAGFLEGELAAAALHDRASARRSAENARVNAGAALLELGAYERAEAFLREALAAAREMGLPAVEMTALTNLGAVLVGEGRPEEARAVEREAIARCLTQGDRRLEGASRVYLAQALALAAEHDDARKEARAAVELIERAAPPLLPWTLAVLARIDLSWGDVESALAGADRARTLLDAGDVEAGEALVRLAHAEALEATGRREEAGAALREACARLTARAARISDVALRRSFLLRVPENARTFELARSLAG